MTKGTNETERKGDPAVVGHVWYCTIWELGALGVTSVGRAGRGSSGLSGRGVTVEGT
jgi:hypothetical protein